MVALPLVPAMALELLHVLRRRKNRSSSAVEPNRGKLANQQSCMPPDGSTGSVHPSHDSPLSPSPEIQYAPSTPAPVPSACTEAENPQKQSAGGAPGTPRFLENGNISSKAADACVPRQEQVALYPCCLCWNDYGYRLCTTCCLPFCHTCWVSVKQLSSVACGHKKVRMWYIPDQREPPRGGDLYFTMLVVSCAVLYPMVIANMGSVIRCIDIDTATVQDSLLASDTRISCLEPSFFGWRLAGIVLFLFYGLLVPGFIVLLLRSKRKRLCSLGVVRQLGFLYLPYVMSWYMWKLGSYQQN
eukprot:gene12982-biopygen7148